MPVLRDNSGRWLLDRQNQHAGKPVPINAEMQKMKKRWEKDYVP
jgi:hypothetical protein